MKDDQLNRLLKAAARAETNSGEGMPFGFDTRVIAHWKKAPGDLSLMLFRRALACACAVAIATFALSYKTLSTSQSTELAIADTAMETAFNQ